MRATAASIEVIEVGFSSDEEDAAELMPELKHPCDAPNGEGKADEDEVSISMTGELRRMQDRD